MICSIELGWYCDRASDSESVSCGTLWIEHTGTSIVIALSPVEAKNRFADTLNHVAHSSEPIAIQRPGEEPVYLISASDYALFRQLLQQAEDRLDLQEAEARMADPTQERVSYAQFFAELEE